MYPTTIVHSTNDAHDINKDHRCDHAGSGDARRVPDVSALGGIQLLDAPSLSAAQSAPSAQNPGIHTASYRGFQQLFPE